MLVDIRVSYLGIWGFEVRVTVGEGGQGRLTFGQAPPKKLYILLRHSAKMRFLDGSCQSFIAISFLIRLKDNTHGGCLSGH